MVRDGLGREKNHMVTGLLCHSDGFRLSPTGKREPSVSIQERYIPTHSFSNEKHTPSGSLSEIWIQELLMVKL